MTWDIKDTQGDETGKIRWELVPYTKGRGLDVGCGPVQAFPHFTSISKSIQVIPLRKSIVAGGIIRWANIIQWTAVKNKVKHD